MVLCSGAGEREEYLVEGRPTDAEVVEGDPGLLETAPGVEQQPGAFSRGNADEPCSGVGPRSRLAGVGEQGSRAIEVAGICHACLQRGAAGLRLERKVTLLSAWVFPKRLATPRVSIIGSVIGGP